MKIHSSNRRAQGSILMVTLVISAVIGLTLASYLTLVSSANRSIMRSQVWNSSIALIEAGLEEALAHLNSNCYSNTINNTAVDWEADGWAAIANGVQKTNRLATGHYVVTIDNTDPERPVVTSQGFVPAPLASFYNPFVATAGAQPKSQHLTRTVLATTQLMPMFNLAMAADGNIDLRGRNVRVDSFDSSDPDFSTDGRWDPDKPRKDNGGVATNSGVIDSLDIGNATIHGRVATGPGGKVSLGPNGVVGDNDFVADSNNKGKVQDGRMSDDMNVDFPPVTKPPGTYMPMPPGGSITNLLNQVETYDHILIDGRYDTANLSGRILVTGDAVLHVSSSINLTGNNRLDIADTGSLRLYMSGSSANFAGNSDIAPRHASQFQYYGLPTNTEVKFAGNNNYTGIVYAPNARLLLGGGGNNDYDFVGASITKSVSMNGHYKFHYDEALQNWGPRRGFIITHWEEL